MDHSSLKIESPASEESIFVPGRSGLWVALVLCKVLGGDAAWLYAFDTVCGTEPTRNQFYCVRYFQNNEYLKNSKTSYKLWWTDSIKNTECLMSI